MKALDDHTRKQLAAFCASRRVKELAIFGSLLRGQAGADSDVDLLVDFHQDAHPTLLDLADMQRELAEIFGRPVDLLTRRGIESSPNRLRREAILSSAEVVHVA
ncbi:MAG: nucleotidyltransferase family protein [Thermodesulfobacteriota bacterium]